MNTQDIRTLIGEWMHAVPCDRVKLEAVLAEEYQRARESIGDARPQGVLLDWLLSCIEVEGRDKLENDLAAMLEAQMAREQEQTAAQHTGRLAAYRIAERDEPMVEMPSDSVIRKNVRDVLGRLNREEDR